MPPQKRKNQRPNQCPALGSHRYAKLNRTQLQVIICVGCGKERRMKKLLSYNKRRRKYRIEKNLHSLVVPITAHSSINLLGNVAQQFQIVSNVLGHHLSLAEGLALPHSTDEARTWPIKNGRSSKNTTKSRSSGEDLIVEPIRKAMSLNNHVRVQRINLLPTYRGFLLQRQQRRDRDGPRGQSRRQRYKESNQVNDGDFLDERLVLLETEFEGPELARAVQDLHNNVECCLLPQYPLHVSMGTVTVTPSMIPDLIAELHRDLVGKELALNCSGLTLLDPPQPEKTQQQRTPEHGKRKYNNIATPASSSAYDDTEEEDDEEVEEEEHEEICSKRSKSDPDQS